MQQNWQTRLNQSHADAFRVAVLSSLVTDRFRCLVAQAINAGLTPEKFRYLTEKELKTWQ
ncbi:hypothetical protein HVY71_00545 [Citrobacter freundii]|uniref:hypothetical protein n=1 Tax=Citrobacter TaxID=544 RepID=UPI000537BA80|nr:MULTISPECIES: hypothetical protein [Citrobacter freundii complex]HAT1573018.1 hypothetical protein [Kluyvera cryocrescens]ATX97208.1 hypothetical protein AM349_14440 [Citrobacter freundii]AUU27421.1 hypothetical protein MC62_016215 [Citrobacter freundii]EJR7284404.1 hypothetical protein [Citrobacter freundii]EKT9243957.1 hypothetical protein [Citrobacter freundii]